MTTGPESKLRISKPHSAPRVVKWESLIPWMQAITRQMITRISMRGALTAQETLDSIDFQIPAGGAAAPDHAWRVRKAGGTDFTLTAGHVNSMVPSNMTTTFSASTAGKFVWVKATLNEYGSVTAVILESNNTPPTPSTAWFNAESPPTYAYYPLCKVTSDSGAISLIEQICSSNLTLTRDTSAVGCSLSEYQVRWIENAAS